MTGSGSGSGSGPGSGSGCGSGCGSFASRCRARVMSPLTPIFILVFVDLFAVALVMPLMPQIRTNLGIEPHTWGLLSSWYGAAQFISSLFMGRISDAYGRRLVFAISCMGAAISYQLMTHAMSLWMLFVARLIVGLCKQTTSTAHALIGDWSDPSQRATMLGNVNMMIGLAMIVGSPAGGHLARIDFFLPVQVATALFVVEFFIIVYWLRTPPPVATPGTTPAAPSHRKLTPSDSTHTTVNVHSVHVASITSNATESALLPDTPTARSTSTSTSTSTSPAPSHPVRMGLFRTLLYYIRDPLLSKILVILVLFYISTKSYRDSLHITLQTRYSLTPVDLGWISSYLGILSALIQGFALKPLTSRFDERKLTFICLGGQCVGHAICSVAPSLRIFMIFYPIIAVTSGVLRTSLVGIVTKAVPRSELGTVLGMISSLGSLTYIIGPTIGGLAITYYGPTAPHLMSVAMALLIILYAQTSFPDLHGVNKPSQSQQTLPSLDEGSTQEMVPLIHAQHEGTGTHSQAETDTSDIDMTNQVTRAPPASPPTKPTITSAGMHSPHLGRPRSVRPKIDGRGGDGPGTNSPPLSPGSPTSISPIAPLP